MENHKTTAAVEWTYAQVLELKRKYPHLTDMEIARRSGWSVFAVARILTP